MSAAPPPLVENRYRLIDLLGRGGMGRVWLARDELLNRDVAVKEVLLPAGLSDEERSYVQARSLREARAIARLDHPNVVRVFDVVSTDGGPWIVMEYVPSRSLEQILSSDGPLPPDQAVRIGIGILAALRAAHDVGILHRDVKPANVLLGFDGRVVLTDFGLAAIDGDPNLTRTGMLLGTPAYLAPERVLDRPGGAAADLWALGATLYAAVDGASPYARTSSMSTLAALTTEPVPTSRSAGPLGPVLNGLLVKDPDKRIDAAQADRLLRAAASSTRARPGSPVPIDVGAPRPRGRGRRRRRRPLALVVCSMLVLAIALAAARVSGLWPGAAAHQRHAGAAPVSTPRHTTTPKIPLPAGWYRYVDSSGFSVAVPDGWTVEQDSTIVYFSDPDEGRLLTIDQNYHPKTDVVTDWIAQEASRTYAGDLRDYRRIRIAPVRYFTQAADWEFTYTDDQDTEVHAVTRGFVTAPGKGYAIHWSTAAVDWASNLANFKLVLDSFVPAPSGRN